VAQIGGHSASVLIADDDALVRMVLRLAIEAGGHRVTEAADGDELCAAVGHRSFELCVMDASMPGPELGDRLDFLRSASPSMTVVVISGSAVRPESLKLNNAEFLHKPINLKALNEVLADLAPVARDGGPGE
jgi:two-component system OmpR family response regulator